MQRPDSDDDEAAAKLFPEWDVQADDQVVLAGLAAVVGLLFFFGWNVWRGGDDLTTVASSVVSPPSVAFDRPDAGFGDLGGSGDLGAFDGVGGASVATNSSNADGDESGGDATNGTANGTATDSADDNSASPTTSIGTSSSSTGAGLAVGDVSAALSVLPGAITAGVDGSVALLDGFVANQAESDTAEQVAGGVDGVERVENNLVVLEPLVITALEQAGVVGASAIGIGTEVTLTGTIQSEDARAAILSAAAGVEGVTAVEDQLQVSVAADLNQLPQVQFTTGSADILPTSFSDLDAAAALITSADGVKLSVVGWTDTRGDDTENRELSLARADAVVAYLVGAGVADAALTAIGNGETDQFAAGETPEAFQANRVVLFEQTG